MVAHLHEKEVQRLELIANKLRQHVIQMVAHAGSGHQGGPLGLADIFAVLYFHVLRQKPKQPMWEERDRLILSNGHTCPIRYAAMAEAGYFPKKELLTLRELGSRLQGHPERVMMPALESTSGPLGAGLAQAAGIAYAARMDKKTFHTFCVTSDGEHEAGLHWEAAMFAGKNRLDNLIAIVDRNNIQIDGDTEDIMPLEPLHEKYESFNWFVIECNGNDIRDVVRAIEEAKVVRQKPIVIIAHTVPGEGVTFMENDFHWHSAPFKDDQAAKALKELRGRALELKADHKKR